MKLEELKCFGIDGKPIDAEKVAKRIEERTPVILVNHQQAISPYFSAILKPDVMFVVIKE